MSPNTELHSKLRKRTNIKEEFSKSDEELFAHLPLLQTTNQIQLTTIIPFPRLLSVNPPSRSNPLVFFLRFLHL